MEKVEMIKVVKDKKGQILKVLFFAGGVLAAAFVAKGLLAKGKVVEGDFAGPEELASIEAEPVNTDQQ